MDKDEVRKLIRREVEEIWHTRNLELHQQTSHPHRVSHLPGSAKQHGPEEHKQEIARYFAAFSDIHIRIEHLVVEGDMAAARLTVTGKQTGAFMGVPPTGKQMTLTSHNFFRIEGDKIAETWVEYDRLALMEQLGLTPTMGAGA